MVALFTGVSFLTVLHFIIWLLMIPVRIARLQWRRRNRVGILA